MKLLGTQLAVLLSERQLRRNMIALLQYVAFLGAMIALFSVAFHFIMAYEGRRFSWVTGVYWTLTVMSTLGFGDITFTSDIGKLFSIIVLISGLVFLLILLPFVFISYFYAPWLDARMRLRAPRQAPEGTRDHVIITSYDTIAPGLIDRLRIQGIPYFLIEPDPAVAARMHGDGLSVVIGEVDSRATYEALRAADARLVVANCADMVNTNITLTVREVAPRIPIAAIVDTDDSIDILELSGATHVLPLKRRLGEQLANRINASHARTHVIGSFHDLKIAEFPVQNTPLAGRAISDLKIREAIGINIIAVWERGRLLPARPDLRLSEHSVVVVAGTDEQIQALDYFLVIYAPNYSPVVIIGGGKVGCAVAQTLRRQEIPVHIVEHDAVLAERLREISDRLVLGEAADREVLMQAGLMDAPSVVLTTNADDTNIYLTVYCRRLNPHLRIVSRITHERNMEAIHRAGADFVLSYASLGVEALMAILQGRSLIMLGEGVDLFDIPVPPSLHGKTLAESEIGGRTGLNVIAIQQGGALITNPASSTTLLPDSRLIAVGSPQQRRVFDEQFSR